MDNDSPNGDTSGEDQEDDKELPLLDPILTLEKLFYQVLNLRRDTLTWQIKKDAEMLHLINSVNELAGLVQNSEKARAEDMRVFNRELNEVNAKLSSLTESFGEVTEQVGRLMAEVAQNNLIDSIQEDNITGVQSLALVAKEESSRASERAKQAAAEARKKRLVIFGERSVPTAVVLALYEIGRRLGWW